MSTVKRTEEGKKRAAEIRLKYNKFTYENVGIRYKRGVSKVINCIAEDMGFSLSNLFRTALNFYIQQKSGKNILTNEKFCYDINILMDIILILSGDDADLIPKDIDKTKNVYIFVDNFNFIENIRAKAEDCCGEKEVLSKNDFFNLFEYNKKACGYFTEKNTLNLIYKYLYLSYK